jgi:hypothetical protein
MGIILLLLLQWPVSHGNTRNQDKPCDTEQEIRNLNTTQLLELLLYNGSFFYLSGLWRFCVSDVA